MDKEKGLYRTIIRPEDDIHHLREVRNADLAILIEDPISPLDTFGFY